MLESYVIVYDAAKVPDQIESRLIIFIGNMKGVSNWTHPFKGLFFVVSDRTSRDIRNTLGEFLGKEVGLFISPVGLGESHGALPETVWEWFEKHVTRIP